MASPIQRITRSVPQMPSWLRQQMLADEAMQFAPRPSVDEIVARMGLPGDVEDFLGRRPAPTTEDALRQLAREAGLAERVATRATDEAMTQDVNIFGAPVKTIEQGRALGERNLPGIENLSPEDQLALAQALDKGAMLRSMTATSPPVSFSHRQQPSGLPLVRTQYGNRAQSVTGEGVPFLPSGDLSMGQALALLGNKRQMRQAFGFAEDLPNPPALRPNALGELVPSATAEALGGDVADLVRTIRQDQIYSKLAQLDEAQSAQLMEDMSRSADEVAAMEARAREYGGLPPETVREMDRSNRSHMSTMAGRTERLTGNPPDNWARQMGGNMDTVVGSPLYPPSQKYLPSSYDTYADYFWETQGKPMMKGFGLGHVLSYPLIYAAYQMMKPDEPTTLQSPASAPDDAANWQAERERAVAESQKEYEAEQTRKFMDSLPDTPIAFDQEPVVRTPETPVGLPSEDAMAIDSMGDDAALAAESTPIPDAPDLDALLAESGLITQGTSPEMAARRRDVWQRMKAQDDLNTLMREAGLGGYEGDLTKVDRDYLRRSGSVFSPDSLNYRLEQEYRRRGGNPYGVSQ